MRTKAKRSTHELASLLLTIGPSRPLDAVEAVGLLVRPKAKRATKGPKRKRRTKPRYRRPAAPQSRPGRRRPRPRSRKIRRIIRGAETTSRTTTKRPSTGSLIRPGEVREPCDGMRVSRPGRVGEPTTQRMETTPL